MTTSKSPIDFKELSELYQKYRDFFASCGRKGGRIRARRLSQARQSEIGRTAVSARWARYHAAQKQAKQEVRP